MADSDQSINDNSITFRPAQLGDNSLFTLQEEEDEMTPLRYQNLEQRLRNMNAEDNIDSEPNVCYVRDRDAEEYERRREQAYGNPFAWIYFFLIRFAAGCRDAALACSHQVRSEFKAFRNMVAVIFYKAVCQWEKAMAAAKVDNEQAIRVIPVNHHNLNHSGISGSFRSRESFQGQHHHTPSVQTRFPSNHVTTAKYSIVSFVPRFLFEQFSRYANVFFLLISVLQVTLPEYSPTGQFTTAAPLTIILCVTALKEIFEDFKRHAADSRVNNSKAIVLRNGGWERVRWHQLRVGDIVRVESEHYFPADLILLSSSAQHGIAYIETAQLDGETNLKMRKALQVTADIRSLDGLSSMNGLVECASPNRHLYEFRGNITVANSDKTQAGIPLSLGPEQLLLRGSALRNTKWINGLIVYTGHETKLMLNSTSAPLKQSGLEQGTNYQIVFLCIILLTVMTVCGIANLIVRPEQLEKFWYLSEALSSQNMGGPVAQVPLTFITFLILYNNLVPISLLVTLEVIKFVQAIFISCDQDMYDPISDTPAAARTSNLNEELGRIHYIFSDKTGTLTRNVMVFRTCSIAGQLYGDPCSDSAEKERLFHDASRLNGAADRFLTAICLCHTVVPEKGDEDDQLRYMASSPDEYALVSAARTIGYSFVERHPDSLTFNVDGESRQYDLLQVLEFTSARRRMSVIVRDRRTNRIWLYIKGADVAILDKLTDDQQESADRVNTEHHLEVFATRGLRTLCIAEREIQEVEYAKWSEEYMRALADVSKDRAAKVADICEKIELNLQLLGVTAIEDRLQEGVPETVASLLSSQIRVWVLTGDRAETAINVAHACRLFLPPPAPMLTLMAPEGESDMEQCDTVFNSLKLLDEQRKRFMAHGSTATTAMLEGSPTLPSYSFVVDGIALRFILTSDMMKELFLLVAMHARSVMCCRVSPLQKAEVVNLVRHATPPNDGPVPTTLAIGDGANDVSMIRAAHVGVGISGVEGLQAVCAADYAIAQFRFLKRLLFVHGTLCYRRLSNLVLYSFYKNVTLYAINMWFAYFCGWSGTPLFDRWLIALYNVFFTSLPAGPIGSMDWPAPASELLRHPGRFYVDGQKNRLFNAKVFWTWMADAIWHSGVVFVVTIGIASAPTPWMSDGLMADHITAGNFAYTSVLIITAIRAALILQRWHFLSFLGIIIGPAFWFVFALPVYSYLYPYLNFPDMSGQVGVLYASPVFWMVAVFLTPMCALLLDVVATIISRMQNLPERWQAVFGRSYVPAKQNDLSDKCSNWVAHFRSRYKNGASSNDENVVIGEQRAVIPDDDVFSPSTTLGTAGFRDLASSMTAATSASVTSLPTTATTLTLTPNQRLSSPPTTGHQRSLSYDLAHATAHGYAFSQDETGVLTQTDLLRIWGSSEPPPEDVVATDSVQVMEEPPNVD